MERKEVVADEGWDLGERYNDPCWGAQLSLNCVTQFSLCLLETLSGKAYITFENLLWENLYFF